MITGDEEALANTALLFIFIVGIPATYWALGCLIDRWRSRYVRP